MGMGEERAKSALEYVTKLFPRWKTTDELNKLWVDLFAKYDAETVSTVLKAHRAGRRGNDPSLTDVHDMLRGAAAQKLIATTSTQQGTSIWDAHRRRWGMPNLSDTDVCMRYYAAQAVRQRAQGGVMGTLILDCERDLRDCGMGDMYLDQAVRECCGLSATEQRQAWREHAEKYGEQGSPKRVAAVAEMRAQVAAAMRARGAA